MGDNTSFFLFLIRIAGYFDFFFFVTFIVIWRELENGGLTLPCNSFLWPASQWLGRIWLDSVTSRLTHVSRNCDQTFDSTRHLTKACSGDDDSHSNSFYHTLFFSTSQSLSNLLAAYIRNQLTASLFITPEISSFSLNFGKKA